MSEQLTNWVDAILEVAAAEGMKDSVKIPTWGNEIDGPPLTVGAVREIARLQGGAKEIARLTLALTAQGERLKAATEMLSEIEWQDYGSGDEETLYCASCGRWKSKGHDSDCALAAILYGAPRAAAQDQRGGGA